jgi:hypothetical protein
LDEQDEQQEHDDFDDEAIADMYDRGVSMSCQMWAHVVGMQDQREAELICDEDEDDSSC